MKKILTIIFVSCFVVADDEFFEPGTIIGGYGELHYTNATVDEDDPTTKLDFHRWILFVNHNFSPEWSMKSELEIEHNMIDGDGDYDGEVELEQAYINYHNANGNWGFGAGVVLISAGIINETHEPPTFLSVERPSYNSKIIPTTWFGNGGHVYGSFGDFHAKFVLHEDMKGDAIGNGTGLRSARAKGYKSKADSWTMNFSGKYTGVKGLKLGGSMTMNDSPRSDSISDNGTPDDDTDDIVIATDRSIAWNLMELHAAYNTNNIIGAFEWGNISYDPSSDDVAEYGNSMGYYIHLGYDVAPLMGWNDCKLAPWFGMGMYNLDDTDDVNSVSTTQVGLTWWPTDKISWKMDYTMDTKKAAEGSDDTKTNTLSLGVGYMF